LKRVQGKRAIKKSQAILANIQQQQHHPPSVGPAFAGSGAILANIREENIEIILWVRTCILIWSLLVLILWG